MEATASRLEAMVGWRLSLLSFRIGAAQAALRQKMAEMEHRLQEMKLLLAELAKRQASSSPPVLTDREEDEFP